MSSTTSDEELLTIVAGSYEGQLCGFSVTAVGGAAAVENCAHKPLFAFSAHAGCIRTLACGGAQLVAGSTDNTISVYNLRKRRSYGKLLQQEGGGALNCLRFYADSHMQAQAACALQLAHHQQPAKRADPPRPCARRMRPKGRARM